MADSLDELPLRRDVFILATTPARGLSSLQLSALSFYRNQLSIRYSVILFLLRTIREDALKSLQRRRFLLVAKRQQIALALHKHLYASPLLSTT